jgi:hypothetical protein
MATFKKDAKNWAMISNFSEDVAVQVGIVEKQTHPSGLDMAGLQVTHHYGVITKNIPARDVYIQPTERRKNQIMERIQEGIKIDDFNIDKLAKISGEAVLQEAVLHTFRTGEGLAMNAPSTIKAKGSASPLVDEGDLMRAQAWKVVKK